MIQNPVLRGFNPDPSIIRVNDDYYIATSTFEWFAGVQIHHSKDLVNWELIPHPLQTVEQLDLKGIPNSGGVWAPCLSYCDGVFYLLYSISRTWVGVYKDVDNFIVTTTDIKGGNWSKPIYVNSSGFDASLFHDPITKKKWVTCVNWDYRKNSTGNATESFCGIILQEYDEQKQELVGEVYNIFEGTEIGLVEAPHIYYKDGYYYLMTAEGGTFKEHAVTLCRSKNITKNYELHPQNPVLTSVDDENLTLQRAGHASIVDTPNGEWYMAHLCGRPHHCVEPNKPEVRCNLGRETALQKMCWIDDWLYIEGGGHSPKEFVPEPNNADTKREWQKLFVDSFEKEKLSLHFNSLRVPMTEDWVSLSKNKGKLSLKGRESLFSPFYQSTVARRVQHFDIIAQTKVTFSPENHYHSAGLIYYYDTDNHYYLRITHDATDGVICNVLESDFTITKVVSNSVKLDTDTVSFKVEIIGKDLQFYYSLDDENFIKIGGILDATKMSDEYVGGHFTGSFVGMHACDMNQKRKWAEFDYFKYEELG